MVYDYKLSTGINRLREAVVSLSVSCAYSILSFDHGHLWYSRILKPLYMVIPSAHVSFWSRELIFNENETFFRVLWTEFSFNSLELTGFD